MKTHSLHILLILLAVLLFSTCQKEQDNPSGNSKVELSAIAIDTISFFDAKISTTIKNGKNSTLSSHGFCWGTQPNPDITKEKNDLGSTSSVTSISSTINNLQPNQKYYIRAYASITGGTIYSDQSEFMTLKTGRPMVITDSVIHISYTTVQCKGIIQSDSGLTTMERGICWNTNPNPDIFTNHTSEGIGKGIFKSNIFGLTPNTTYYVRAYGTNTKDISYGEQKSFSTLALSLPTLTTANITNITSNSAGCGGDATADGGSLITDRGICWSTSINPSIVGSHSNEGAGAGIFTSAFSALIPATIYYVRAYATNSTGTAYGNQQSFTTLSGFACGTSITINHIAGSVTPVSKTISYGTVTNILGEPTKCWITSNLGSDHQATSVNDASEASAGWYWQFNRKQGYKHDGTTRTPVSTWIASNDNLSATWEASKDPCSIELGSGWRLPTNTEWTNVDAIAGWLDWNGPWNSELKMHSAGFIYNNFNNFNCYLADRGTRGYYWSSSSYSASQGWHLSFTSGNSDMPSNEKANGFSVRCLRD
ncbi:MAG: hypothetical protein ACOYN4_01775 [Bacteroidales bacterium]